MPNKLYISPTPDAAYPLRLKAIVRPDGLSVEAQTSWLGTHVGDVLLYAALIESWIFLKNSEKANESATVYASLLPMAKTEVGKLTRRTYVGVGTAPQPSPVATGA